MLSRKIRGDILKVTFAGWLVRNGLLEYSRGAAHYSEYNLVEEFVLVYKYK